MYQDEYYILKDSGTYSNALEAFGLATILSRLLNDRPNSIRMLDANTHYVLKLVKPLSEEIVKKIKYFDAFPYIKYKDDIPPQDTLPIDYDYWKNIKANFTKFRRRTPKPTKTEIENYEPKPHLLWDLLSSINKLKVLPSYKKIFLNVKNNEEVFTEFIQAILILYSDEDGGSNTAVKKLNLLSKEKVLTGIENVKSLQMLNPHQGKGTNFEKAKGIAAGQENAFWLREYLKLIGTYKSMFIKPIQVSSKTWDTKIYVLAPIDIDFDRLGNIYNEFRPTLKGSSSLKLDISSILRFCKTFIQNLEEYKQNKPFLTRYNPHYFVNGFYTSYLKKLGTSEAVTNLSVLQLPLFIDVNSHEAGDYWIKILDEHLIILAVGSIDEAGIGLGILQLYRQFITTSEISFLLEALSSYSEFLMQELSKKHYYIYPFSQSLLEKFFELTKEYFMSIENKSLAPVFKVEGFQNIAKAIRKSTVFLQYHIEEQKNYNVRYGLAQDLKRKSLYKEELITYLLDFISSYNSETARVLEIEKKKGNHSFIPRAIVRNKDIEELVALIDEYGSNIIGKLLAAYGYAFDRKEKVVEKDELVDSEIEN